MKSALNISKAWINSSLVDSAQNLNPQNKKVVFLVGDNATAHSILNLVLREFASMGIHADVYLTDVPQTPSIQAKLAIPENRNFAFYERLPIDVIYQIIEARPTLLEGDELDDEIKYSPRQLAEFYKERGIHIQIERLANVNAPEFVSRINNDPAIAMAYNLRNMQILKTPLINAFNSKKFQTSGSDTPISGYIANTHPGPLPSIPGTHTAFWARMNGRHSNEWTLHVIDKGIDTGPILDRCGRAFGNGKTLLQSMIGMDRDVAQMVVTNTRLFFEGTPRPPLPQTKEGRPPKNYSYPTHKEWEMATSRGIIAVNPEGYALALAREFTGGTENAPRLYLEISLACLKAIKEWEKQYEKMLKSSYGKLNDNPSSLTPV